MSELAWYFSKKPEVELHLVLYGISRQIFFKLPENIIIHKPQFRFLNKYRFYFTLKTLFYLRKTIRAIKPDTILSFGEYWNNFVLLALLYTRFPVYVSDRSQPNKSLGKFQELLRKWLYPGSAGVIVQSQKALEIYKQKFKRLNIHLIGNHTNIITSHNAWEITQGQSEPRHAYIAPQNIPHTKAATISIKLKDHI